MNAFCPSAIHVREPVKHVHLKILERRIVRNLVTPLYLTTQSLTGSVTQHTLLATVCSVAHFVLFQLEGV